MDEGKSGDGCGEFDGVVIVRALGMETIQATCSCAKFKAFVGEDCSAPFGFTMLTDSGSMFTQS